MFETRMTLDKAFRNVTILSATLVGGGTAAAVTAGSRAGRLAFVFGCGVLLFAWAMAPRGVVVGDGELLVLRRAWPAFRVPLASIREAVAVDSLGKRAIRLFGVGGFFGSYGVFLTDTLGRFRLYATRRGQAVVVRRNDSKLPVVLTPDDVQGTLAALGRTGIGRV
jgi:hypothetical protein